MPTAVHDPAQTARDELDLGHPVRSVFSPLPEGFGGDGPAPFASEPWRAIEIPGLSSRWVAVQGATCDPRSGENEVAAEVRTAAGLTRTVDLIDDAQVSFIDCDG